MRALVTGARGFVGGHLVTHLTSSGDEVLGVDRAELDVTDFDQVRAVVSAFAPDIVFHLAALTHVGDSWADPVEYTRVNVLGTKFLLDAVHEGATSATVVLVSSADVYGVVAESDLPIHEDFRVSPANPYASSKVEAEHVAHEAVRQRDQSVLIARPFNHLGPGQSERFVIPALVGRLLDALAEGANEIRVGDLSVRRDFSDVRDVVRAYRLLALYGARGETYHVASGHDVALIDIAHELVDTLAPGVALVRDESLVRPVEIPVMRGSIERLHDATGWEPTTSLSASLRDVIADLHARRG